MRKTLIFFSKRVLPHKIRLKLINWWQNLESFIRYGETRFVNSVAIEVSTFCNRTCHYCPNSTNKTPLTFMSDEVFGKILERLQEIKWRGPVDYNFYNEPTLDKRLPELVARTVKALPNSLPRVITNGDFLTEAYIEKMIAAGLINFSVTRHPPFTPEWDTKMNHLRAKYADYITYSEIWNEPGKLSNRAGAVSFDGFKPITSCDSPYYALNIMRNGDIQLCCADYHRKHPMGNIMEQSIMEIWRSPVYVRLRKEVKNGIAKLDICRACFGLPHTKTQ